MTTKSKIAVTNDHITFLRPDGTEEFAFRIDSVHPDLRDAVYAYGLKQILADAGAVGRDVPAYERLNKMETRAQSLKDGTWGFRDGSSAPTAAAQYVAQFQCMVDAGLVSGDDAARAAWKSATAAQRRAVWESDGMAAARDLFEQRKPKPRADVGSLLGALGIA